MIRDHILIMKEHLTDERDTLITDHTLIGDPTLMREIPGFETTPW